MLCLILGELEVKDVYVCIESEKIGKKGRGREKEGRGEKGGKGR